LHGGAIPSWLISRLCQRKAERVMNRLYLIAATLACASVAACSGGTERPAADQEPPLAGARIGGPFTLTDQNGRSVTDRDFAGRYRLIYFGYSFCPDVCPVDMNRLMLGLRAFQEIDAQRAARIQPIFITIDPERDRPETLGRFAAQFDPRLLALSGTSEQIRSVADAYLVRYSRQEGGRPDAYLMAHTQLAYLMGPQGEPVALLPIDDPRTPTDEGAPDLVAAELARWVR
jgi:protein SCO1